MSLGLIIGGVIFALMATDSWVEMVATRTINVGSVGYTIVAAALIILGVAS